MRRHSGHKPTMAEGSQTVDAASKAFSDRFKDMVLSAYTTLNVSFGLDLGLFNVMAQVDTMLTAAEIAERASCKERYVKEWLDHMALSDIVQIDETGTRYLFPVSHREAVTSRNGFFRSVARILPYLAMPHEDLLQCARKEGPSGLPFSAVERSFREFKADMGDATSYQLLDAFVQNIPGIEAHLERGIFVCDLGCGSGEVALELSRRYPKSHVTGIDIFEPAVAKAASRARESNLANINFVQGDASSLPPDWNEKFDFIYMRHTLHDIPLASRALTEALRCLKPGGRCAVVEFDLPTNKYESLQIPAEREKGRILLLFSLYHCVPASMALEGSQALGAGVGREALGVLMQAAGFISIAVTSLASGDVLLHGMKSSS